MAEPVPDDDGYPLRCDACGVPFTVPTALGVRHERVGRAIWCPLGHLVGADFREPIGLALQRAQDQASELATDLAHERYAHRITRRVLVAERHRLMLGLCPLCPYEAKGLGTHLRKAHPHHDTDETV